MKIKSLVGQLLELAQSERAKSTLWALVGLAGPTLLQLIYMIFAARILGAELTGNFFLIVSVALITSAFVGLGGGGLVMRDVSRDHDAAKVALGRAFAMSFVTFPLLFPLVLLAANLLTKGAIPLWAIALIGLSDLLAARMLTTCWSLFIAREEQIRASLLICTMPLARLGAIGATAYWPSDDRLLVFSTLYFGVSFGVLGCVLIYVFSVIGRPILSLRGIDHKGGTSFSLTWLNQALQTESDKIILGIFGNPAMVAVYGVASRLMDGAAMPPRALKVSFQSWLFREGAKGHEGTYRLTLKILPFTIVYGILVWLAFYLLAAVLVWIFGPEFSALETILPVFGALPLFRAIADYGAEVFLSSDRPSIQAATQSFATVLRIGLGFALIPLFALEGAVATALAVNIVTGSFLWGLAWSMSRKLQTRNLEEES